MSLEKENNQKILDIVLNDEITWEYLILDIIKEEGIDPWNLDLGKLTTNYIERIKNLEDIDFRLSGKIILIASILLRLKSKNFVLIEKDEKSDVQKPVGLLDEIEITEEDLIPNIPQPKKRKVTLEELMSALQKALQVEDRKKEKRETKKLLEVKQEFKIRFKNFNLTEKVNQVFNGIKIFIKNKGYVFFTQLIKKGKSKQEIVWTFLPLMHLANKHEIILEQEKNFKDIKIRIPKEGE